MSTKKKSKRKKHSLTKRLPEWTPLQPAMFEGLDMETMTGGHAKKFGGVFLNSRYQVTVYRYDTAWGELTWLAIVNRDRSARHDWRDFQRIKNELLGPEIEAFEIYPAESRLVDTNNQFHLFCLPMGRTIPVGYVERDVCDLVKGAHKQRPFDELPEGLNERDMDVIEGAVFGPAPKEAGDEGHD